MGGGRGGERDDADLAERYRVDMVTFTPGPHDVRVARSGWVLYVRAVRGGQQLVGPRVGAEVVVGVVAAQVVQWLDIPTSATVVSVGGVGSLLVLVNLARWRRHRTRPWRVGVVRGPDPASWNTGQPVALLEEQLVPGEDPRPRVAELAERARAGDFDPRAVAPDPVDPGAVDRDG